MYPPLGDVLTAGTYSGTASYNGLVVEHGEICSQYAGSCTVKQAIFSAMDNSLKNFDATLPSTAAPPARL